MVRKKTKPLERSVLHSVKKQRTSQLSSSQESTSSSGENIFSRSEHQSNTKSPKSGNQSKTRFSRHSISRKQLTPRRNTSGDTTRVFIKPKKCFVKLFGRREVINAKSLREIKFFQRTVHHLIPKLPFSRLIREIMMANVTDRNVNRVTSEALQCIQEAAELYLVCLFSDCNLAAHHANRKTINVKDMGLVLKLRENK
ncbi:hypothetical protein HHI36_008773 [Cryptolaemus montrouzieri]|uniref:Core Histone H2A/H2B/H3 domain-containing protein n=1 Tax=Cryptolaemus montrouzieri TaxID=559131 RepID=A0ABD2MTK3_9CUCU